MVDLESRRIFRLFVSSVAKLGCVSLGESENGIVISDYSDHGASKEPTNPLYTRIRRSVPPLKLKLFSRRLNASALAGKGEEMKNQYKKKSIFFSRRKRSISEDFYFFGLRIFTIFLLFQQTDWFSTLN